MVQREHLANVASMAILPLAVLAGWEFVARAHLVSTFLLPSFSQVVLRIWQDSLSGEILHSAVGTLGRLTASYAIAAVLGVTLGVMMARIRFVRWLLDPIISIGYPAPKIAFLPIFVLWFGVFDQPKIVISVFSCIFPIIAGTWAGTQGVDKYLLWSAQTLGVRPGALLWQVVLPASLPQVLTALQIALPIAFITVIVAEMLTGGGGLGGTMMESTRLADPPGAFANLIVIGLLGFAAMKGLQWARRRILVWHEEVQRQGDIV
jgi:ABC-type nitrate/sulfonate/bicarbonate transport system permease component